MNKNSKILITGANGFLGANFTRFLNDNGKNLSIFMNKKSDIWRIKNIVKQIDVHYVDIKNKNKVFEKIKEIKPDYVYHFASYGVHPNQNNFENMVQTNILGTSNILQALEKYGVKRLINIGSGAEYGQIKGKNKESDCINPTIPYTITKATQTLFTKYFSEIKKVPSVTLRIFTPYGKFESKGRLISDIMISIIKKKPLFLSSKFAYRDFVFVDDVNNALIKTTTKSKIENNIFNIGGGKAISIKKIVELSQKLSDHEIKIFWNKKESRTLDKFQKAPFADLEKTEKVLGWKPSTTLKNGLEKSYSWYKKNIELY
jgi:nucleoside-diphosphate-sugar epimerase